jgi:hypothetical protein
LQHLARYLSAVPGRKNVIWFSGSFPIVLGMGSMSNPSAGDRDYSQKVRDTSHLLASARVAVYPMDAGGLRAPARFQAANTGLGPAPKDPSLDNRYTMEDIANQTGGVPLFNNNGFAQAIAHAVDNGSSYYTIAYVPQSKDFNGQFRKFKVRIDGCDCQLSYRSGYYADPAGKLGTSGLLQGSPMSSATLHGAPPATQVIFQSRVLPASDPEFKNANLPDVPLAPQTPSLKGPTHRYVVDMAVDPRTLLFESDDNGGRTTALEIAVVAFEADGKRINSVGRNLELALNATQYAMVMSKGVPIRMAIDLPEGHDYLLMAVHDRIASRVGSLEIALHVSAKD